MLDIIEKCEFSADDIFARQGLIDLLQLVRNLAKFAETGHPGSKAKIDSFTRKILSKYPTPSTNFADTKSEIDYTIQKASLGMLVSMQESSVLKKLMTQYEKLNSDDEKVKSEVHEALISLSYRSKSIEIAKLAKTDLEKAKIELDKLMDIILNDTVTRIKNKKILGISSEMPSDLIFTFGKSMLKVFQIQLYKTFFFNP